MVEPQGTAESPAGKAENACHAGFCFPFSAFHLSCSFQNEFGSSFYGA